MGSSLLQSTIAPRGELNGESVFNNYAVETGM
jgi:hypothetical protein